MFFKFKKFIKLFCSSLLAASLLSLPIEAMNNPNSNNVSLKRLGGIAAITMGTIYYGSSLAHEYGHKIVGELLLGNRGTIHIGLAPQCVWEKPIDINSWKSLAVILAGPLAGIAATLGFLKVSDIIDEYCTGKSFFTAVKEGIKKPFFHLGNHVNEMLIIRIFACANLGSQLYHLTPYQMSNNTYSDGYWALRSLKLLIKSPKK